MKISDIGGELGFIEHISKQYCLTGKNQGVYGIGDDCAVIENNKTNYVVTTDILVEKTHFDMDLITPYELGFKSASVNLSDIAGMGAEPKYAFISIGFSNIDLDIVDGIYKGLTDSFNRFGTLILGGDTVKSELGLVINVTLIGETKNPIMRNTAKVGDDIIISDYCGLSLAGLDSLFKYGYDLANTKYSKLVKSHLMPSSHVELGLKLSTTNKITSMMDLSDGLAKDLTTLCKASGVGANINLSNFNMSSDLLEFCNNEKQDIFKYMLSGGEDYILLFTCNSSDTDCLMNLIKDFGYNPSIIGKVTENKDILVNLNDNLVEMPTSWNHF